MNNELSDVSWRRLLHSIRNGNCILFLGPDTARLSPEEKTLTSILADEFYTESNAELYHAAQSYLASGHDEFDLLDTAQSFFQPYENETTDFHRSLASLPFQVVIQTTPDRFMLNAFKQLPGKDPLEAYFHLRSGLNIRGSNEQRFNIEPSAERPVVFGLHGNLEDASSIVLTENDLLEFLMSLVQEKATVPPVLLRKIKMATNCLFVGFGFQRWYQRLILHVLRGQGSANKWRSLALEQQDFFTDTLQKQTATYYESEHRIDFSHLSFWDFARELAERNGHESVEVQAKQALPAGSNTNRPKVFISYDSSYFPQVEILTTQLRSMGIDTWLDKDNLRGGDDWEKQIKHVLSEVVDYFVVLNSSGLQSRESWVHYEVNVAMERAKRMPSGFTFIFPCHFMGNQRESDNLKHIQYIEVPTPEKCQQLAEAILQDWGNNRSQSKNVGAAV